MDLIDNNIRYIIRLSNFINSNSNSANKADIRYVSLHTLAQTAQNFGLSLLLSRKLHNVEFCQENISTDIFDDDLPNIIYNLEGFLHNSFFINFFVHIENHIRQLAIHFENKPKEINVFSIVQSLKKLSKDEKTLISLTEHEIEIFQYYCYLRNTMHNAGFQTQQSNKIRIVDSESIFGHQDFIMEIKQSTQVEFSLREQLVLHEQIVKIIIKINMQIPIEDFIEHRFTTIGFYK